MEGLHGTPPPVLSVMPQNFVLCLNSQQQLHGTCTVAFGRPEQCSCLSVRPSRGSVRWTDRPCCAVPIPFCCVFECVFFRLINLFTGMSHYISNITCIVLYFTLFKFLWHTVNLIITYAIGFVRLLVYSFGSLVSLCFHNPSELIEFTNFWKTFVCLIASLLLDSGHLPPSFIILFLSVSLCSEWRIP
jgi:hypothetical protein